MIVHRFLKSGLWETEERQLADQLRVGVSSDIVAVRIERRLMMMPHPERAFLPWQWPYWPEEWKGMEFSPWLQMFQNAYRWCAQ